LSVFHPEKRKDVTRCSLFTISMMQKYFFDVVSKSYLVSCRSLISNTRDR